MNALILAIYIFYPSKLVTMPTANIPHKYQVSLFNAGVTLGKVYLRIDPVILPADLNIGLKIVKAPIFFEFNASKFYGSRYIKRENVDEISIKADGFNVVAGFTKSLLTGDVYFRKYGNLSSLGIMSGIYIRPLVGEFGFDSYEIFRFGIGVMLSSNKFFLKIGAFSSAKMIKDGKLPILPSINFGVRE